MLLIYSSQSSPRLQYILQLFFNQLIPTEFKFTTDKTEFLSSNQPKLNYSNSRLTDEVFLFAVDLLFENGIRVQKISVREYERVRTLFAHSQASDLPFDPIAASFYLVSRYEEYLPFTPDEHGRFPDKESVSFKNNFHEIPVVNYYAMFLKKVLQQKYPQLVFKNTAYSFQLTYDIDFAFAYHGKGILRNAGGYLRDMLDMDWNDIGERTRVLFGNQKDPFDTFSEQDSLHKKFNLHPVYFFLLGNYQKFDKNISWQKKSLQNLIQNIATQEQTGIHSSYASDSGFEKVKLETERLEKISQKKIVRNRQHFLRLKFPATYQNLIKVGITEDYTMGYASLCGFRAGIAAPFYWYDLSKEETTLLKIFPFEVMDATLYYYLKLSSIEAFEQTKHLVEEVKKVNGYFQFLAHNDLLSEKMEWKGWREKFEEVLSISSSV